MSLITASSLQNDQRHLTGFQVSDEFRDPRIVVGVPRAASFIVECDIQVRFRDVDAHEHFFFHNRTAFLPRNLRLHPTLRDAGVEMALATVRVLPEGTESGDLASGRAYKLKG